MNLPFTLRQYGIFCAHLKGRRWWWIFVDLLRRVYVPILIGMYGAGSAYDVQTGLSWLLLLDVGWICMFVCYRPEAYSRLCFQYLLCMASEIALLVTLMQTPAPTRTDRRSGRCCSRPHS